MVTNSGYGYGVYGYGQVSGSGSGFGGYGHGYEYGHGRGYGRGCYGYSYRGGHGCGYSCGCGYGGPGYGFVSGSGHGCGHGDDNASEYWSAALPDLPMPEAGCVLAYWWSDASGRPCNGGNGRSVCCGLTQTEAGPLKMCGAHTLHATLVPHEWSGERLWVVAMHPPVISYGTKLGSLKRTVLAEISPDKIKQYRTDYRAD